MVGGIKKNIDLKPEFLIKNSLIASNLIHGSYLAKIKESIISRVKLCLSRKFKKISEKILLKGELEKSNEGYALAKIFGIKLCEYYSEYYNLNYFSLMPCNVFGPGDNYDLNTSHFLPAILKKLD